MAKIKVKILKDSFGYYSIADPVGKTISVESELAEKMVKSKHAEFVGKAKGGASDEAKGGASDEAKGGEEK